MLVWSDDPEDDKDPTKEALRKTWENILYTAGKAYYKVKRQFPTGSEAKLLEWFRRHLESHPNDYSGDTDCTLNTVNSLLHNLCCHETKDTPTTANAGNRPPALSSQLPSKKRLFPDIEASMEKLKSDDDEVEETKMLWDNQISDLKQILGSS